MLYNFDFIRSQTAKMRSPSADDTSRDQQIANIIEAKFGCHKEQTRELVELLIERELPVPLHKQATAMPAGVVVTYNRKQCLITSLDAEGDAFVIQANGSTESPSGGSMLLHAELTTDGRVATEAETERFLTRFAKSSNNA